MSPQNAGEAAITGANGLVGNVACDALESAGFKVRRLVRNPRADSDDCQFSLTSDWSIEALAGVDVLVHCAYDMSATSRREIWEANVFGTRRLLDAATQLNVNRCIVVSSMSAYLGTEQIYGRAKLAVETYAAARGMVSVRLGLVYGQRWGGMAGTLRRLASLPVVPLVARHAHQFTLHEEDLRDAFVALAHAEEVPSGPLGLAHPEPVNFERLLRAFSRSVGVSPRYVPMPWRPLYLGLRAAELGRLRLPVRADSFLGLAHAAPCVPGQHEVRALGIRFRPFSMDDATP